MFPTVELEVCWSSTLMVYDNRHIWSSTHKSWRREWRRVSKAKEFVISQVSASVTAFIHCPYLEWYLHRSSTSVCITETSVRFFFSPLHSLSHPGICSAHIWYISISRGPVSTRTLENGPSTVSPVKRKKVYRHLKSPVGSFSLPYAQLQYIHIDIVGPFHHHRTRHNCSPLSSVFREDPKPGPLLILQLKRYRWVSRLGKPSILTTERGSYFN